ncbi:unnamed protein product [Phaedon cochleariae]|uniref:Peptidoglycan recognition protein n=1 Tax=Phaedon cochleariae TaxID=80249 RepID=A0A9P0GTP1_PHACE|nr:unnamed protein product [Phaedon cochleariae]
MTDTDKALKLHLNSTCCENDNEERQSDLDDYYQVDTISTASCQEEGEEEEYEECDGAIIAVAGQPTLPHFGTVSVVNSNDVHFGNKTVYKGPVTIKQFVYPNGNVCPDGVNGFVKSGGDESSEGVDNVCFASECVGETKHNKEVDNGDVEGGVEVRQPHQRKFGKGVRWLCNFSRTRPIETAIIGSIVLVSVAILLAVVLWRFPISKPIVRHDVDEEDNNTPIEYSSDSNATLSRKVHVISRLQWLAQPPLQPTDPLRLPVPLVIVHHTATESCSSHAQCVFQTRHIQTFHIESNGWFDIGYNFLVGGDGDVYEGRGWKKEGAHTFSYNNQSIGVAFIGTFIKEPPPSNMINSFHKLIEKGVESGYLTKDYKIMAARQLHATESPGKSFYEVIKTWSHWTDKP